MLTSTLSITTAKGLGEKVEVMDIADRTQVSLALHEMVSASNGDTGEKFEKMSILLKKSCGLC